MITFNTQKDFEDAVMQVLKDKLNINVITYKTYNKVTVAVELYEHGDHAIMSASKDYIYLDKDD